MRKIVIIWALLLANSILLAQNIAESKCQDFYKLMQMTNKIQKTNKYVKQNDKKRRTLVSKEIGERIFESDTIQVIYNPLWIDYVLGSFQEFVYTDSLSYVLEVPGRISINQKNEQMFEMLNIINKREYSLIAEEDVLETFGGLDYFYYYLIIRQSNNRYIFSKEKFYQHPFSKELFKIKE